MHKDIIASGKLTVKDLLSFLFYHNYSRIGGKLTGVLGLIGLVAAPVFFYLGDTISAIIFAVVAVMYVVITPLDFYSKALRQVKTNPVFKNKMTFTFRDEGLRAIMYTGLTELEWDDVIRVVVRNAYFYVYLKETHALIVPKENFACIDDVELLEDFIEDNELGLHINKRMKEEEHVSEDL